MSRDPAPSFLAALPRNLRLPEELLTIGDRIGHGTHGVVHAALLNDQPVCVKAVSALLSLSTRSIVEGSEEEAKLLRNFVTEVEIAAGLHHDRIVSFRGVCLDPASSKPKYLVMELANCNLSGYLTSLHRTLTLMEFRSLADHVLSGLNYMHTRSPPIMHRDLKPANILVFMDGGRVSFKIGDVGLARFESNSSTLSTGRPTVGAGTVFYMAPEVVERRYTHSVDVFSFGVMMAEVVMGHLHPDRKPASSFRNRREFIAAAVEFMKSRSVSLARMISGCCSVEPKERLTAGAALELVREPITESEAVDRPPHSLSSATMAVTMDAGTQSSRSLDVVALKAAMTKLNVPPDVTSAVSATVDANPATSLDEVVALMRKSGVSVVVAHKVKNALKQVLVPASPTLLQGTTLDELFATLKQDSVLNEPSVAELFVRKVVSATLGPAFAARPLVEVMTSLANHLPQTVIAVSHVLLALNTLVSPGGELAEAAAASVVSSLATASVASFPGTAVIVERALSILLKIAGVEVAVSLTVVLPVAIEHHAASERIVYQCLSLVLRAATSRGTALQSFARTDKFRGLVAAADKHMASPAIAAAVCEVVMVLLTDGASSDVVLSEGLVHRVLEFMVTHALAPAVQKHGCLCVGRFAALFDHGEVRRETIAQGLQLISAAIGLHPSDESVQLAGLTGYRHILSSALKGVMQSDSSCQMTVETTLSRFPDNVQIQSEGLAVLVVLVNRELSRKKFIERGGIDVVLTALQRHADTQSVVLSSCELLPGLTDKDLLVSTAPQTVFPLVTVCSRLLRNQGVTGNVLKFLSAVASETPTIDVISTSKLWIAVHDVMQELKDSSTVQCFGWKLLTACLDHIPASQSDIISLTSLKMLVTAVTSWIEDVGLQVVCCKALVRLLTADPRLLMDFSEIHGLTIISTITATHSYDSELCAVCRSLVEMLQ